MKQTANIKYGELGITIGIALLALLFIVFSDFSQVGGASLGPAFFPRIIAGLVIILCALHVILSLRNRPKSKTEPQTEESNGQSRLKNTKVIYIVGTLLICIVYISLFNLVPYMILTGIFLVVVMFFIGIRRWVVILSVAIIYAVVSYYIFGDLFMIRLT